jgi:hypothetical protein
MFAYASALVEEHIYDEISITTLIVGHTHTRLDQYFSILSYGVKCSSFIGSPLALQYLYETCHKESGKKKSVPPLIQKQIHTIRDWSGAWDAAKVIRKISRISVPHYFLFQRRSGICVLFYKNFIEHSTLSPPEPPNGLPTAIFLDEIAQPEYYICDDSDSIQRMFGYQKGISLNDARNPEVRALSDSMSVFSELSRLAFAR